RFRVSSQRKRTNMNAREGMRRVGIVLGILGGAAGGFVGHGEAQALWNLRSAHNRFELLMASPMMQTIIKQMATKQIQFERNIYQFPDSFTDTDIRKALSLPAQERV